MKSTIFSIFLMMLFYLNGYTQETTVEGADAIKVRQKMTCGCAEEGVTRYGMWQGRGYSRVPGEKDRHLFNVMGINVRQCDVKEDDVRGTGYRSVSREIMVYMDPETNEIMDTWTNPWSGKEVEVVHVANDPVNMRGYSYEKDTEGNYSRPVSVLNYGKQSMSSAEIPLFYANPLGGEYQAYVGGEYHAMEIFNTMYDTEELMNSDISRLGHSYISWSRLAQWLPWMEMGGRAGIMVFNATGFSTFDKSEIWPRLQKILDERYPSYNTPPPTDDPRPNETSWTVFEKFMEGKEKAKVGRH